MAFDMGFDARATAGFVTDPSYGVPVLSEAYPHTYTAGNGNSINAGWDIAPTGQADRVNTNDARIAGINYCANDATIRNFHVDLASGSAPGAGTYTVDFAIGDASGADNQYFRLFDNTTLLINGLNGGVGFATAAGQFVDATLATVTASSSWTGATTSKTFATTTALLEIGSTNNQGGFTRLAHFRLTLQGGGAASFGSMGMLTLMGVGA